MHLQKWSYDEILESDLAITRFFLWQNFGKLIIACLVMAFLVKSEKTIVYERGEKTF
jgi:hypothetical protein